MKNMQKWEMEGEKLEDQEQRKLISEKKMEVWRFHECQGIFSESHFR